MAGAARRPRAWFAIVACVLSWPNRVPAQQREASVAAAGAGFDSSLAYEHLRHIVAFGPRPAGSDALERTRGYIIGQLTALGIRSTRQSFVANTPIGKIPMTNIVATIPGRRPERLAFAGHYDTKLYREFTFVGANDGGSSAAFLLELARVLNSRSNAFTIELIFFDGEEATRPNWGPGDHTYGSQHYVDAGRRSATLKGLKALVLVDMIADRSPRFLREASSTPWLTDLVWTAARKLGHAGVFVDASTPIEDDHVRFLEAGIPATDIIDLDYPAWHTAADTLDQVSARGLQIVGDVLLSALPALERRAAASR